MNDLQKQIYGIAIFEEEIVLSDFTGDGEKRFIVTPEQLMAFVRTEITFRPCPGMIWMKTDGAQERYLLILPAGKRTIFYRQGQRTRKKKKQSSDLQEISLQLPAVAVIATVDLSHRQINGIRMWGFAGKDLQSDTILYELPLPNLSRDSLCLGSTQRVVAGGDVRGAVEMVIFDTPFNHHNHLVGTARIPFVDYVAKHRGRCPLRTLNRLGFGKEILGGDR